MSLDPEERELLAYGALRQEAWALVKDDIAALRGDLDERGVGGRIADRLGEEAREVWDQTLDVASNHRGVVAATFALLVGWLLRGPLFGASDDDNKDRARHDRGTTKQGDDR